MKKIIILFLSCLVLVLYLFLVSCSSEPNRETIYLDEVFSITPYVNIYYKNEKFDKVKIKNEINEYLKSLDDKFNVDKEGSLIARVNNDAYSNQVEVDKEFAIVLSKALEVNKNVSSLYDVTILPLIKLWDFKNKYFKSNNFETIPDDYLITDKLGYIGSNYIKLQNTKVDGVNKYYVRFTKEGVKIDLGSIVKGYASDKVAEILKANNVNIGLINIGGNVYTFGKDFKIGITTPFYEDFAAEANIVGYVKSDNSDYTFVTSGVYERYIKTSNLNMYHHILSPDTGFPIDNDLLSVTICLKKDSLISLEADALSTAIFTLGLEEGLKYLENHSIDAVFITKNKKIVLTSGIKDSFVFNDAVTKYGFSVEMEND